MLKILQLSDIHLQESLNATLYQVSPWKNLQALLLKIKHRMEDIDAIFLSGDISHDGTVGSYQHIAENLQVFAKPIYWFAGNHDVSRLMQATLNDYSCFTPLSSLTLENWQFLVLNTVREGCDEGYLIENTKPLIQTHTFCAVLMHHHPVPVGSALIDKYKLQNPEVLRIFLLQQKKRPQVIITGHVHGGYQTNFDGIPVISSPATCFQFPKETTTLAIEAKGGCTFWQFHKNGTFNYEYVYTCSS